MKTRRISLATTALALTLTASSALAGTSRGFENGGYFTRFDPVVAEFNQSGKPFRIVGLCQSACTLFLSIRNACVERTAVFQFHAGSDGKGKILTSATRHMIESYNPKLRRFVIENRYMETLEFSTISANDMIDVFGYTECTPEHRLATAENDRNTNKGSEGSFTEFANKPFPMAARGNEGSFR